MIPDVLVEKVIEKRIPVDVALRARPVPGSLFILGAPLAQGPHLSA